MKRIYRAGHLVEAMHLKNMLEGAGIECFLRNEFLIRVGGEVPFDQCYPEVWIREESDEAPAMRVFEEFRHPERHRGPAWSCPKCNEWLEGQFSTCWSCGTDRP